VEVHYSVEVKAALTLPGEPCGLDAGVSEVFTDAKGKRYGTGFGQVLTKASQRLTGKGRKRNRLHQLAKKAAAKGNQAKARRIQKHNLGRQKLNQTRRKVRTELERQINAAINQVLDTRQPSVIVTERLDIRGKAKSKRLSRVVSLWVRSILAERVNFKASARGSCRKQVNPAFSSQMCPVCGFVHPGNRQGDRFQCLNCAHGGKADGVAAHNLEARLDDPLITLWTPKARVKAILLDRFTARLEREREFPTVPGRTPDTRWGQSESETTGAISCKGGKTPVRNGVDHV
jgi:transposase